MTSTWIRCLMRTWIVLLLLVFNTSAAQTSCAKPKDFVRCTENVAVGTKLLKIPINPNENWSIFESSPAGYYRTSKGATSLYIEAAHVLDSDVLKEKTDHMYVKLNCKVGNNQPLKYEIMIILTKANEFTPEFNQNFYNRTIPENARINDIVFQPSAFASDKDFRDDITFGVHSGKSPLDGIASKKFRMSNNNIVVNDILDYENQNEYTIEVTAKDSGGKESSTTLVIYISDVDDLGPTFLPKPCTTKNPQCMIPVRYNAHIKAADKGKITISPNAVKAVDNEANHYGVVYSFTDEGNPTNIMKYFQIDPTTAEITKKDEELPKNVTSSVTLFIKAEEVSPLKHSSLAILIIDILDRNSTIIISTKSSDSISVTKIQGYSSDVFYGVLIPLAIIVAALIIFIIVVAIKSKKTIFRNSIEDLNTKTNNPDASSVVIQTDSLVSRKSANGSAKRASVGTVENGYAGVINQAFLPDTENGKGDGDNKTAEELSRVSIEDNDIHPRSLHSDLNLNEFDSCNLVSADLYTAVEDLSKAGISGEDEAKDGDICNTYQNIDYISEGETIESAPEASGSIYASADELNEDPIDHSPNELSDIPAVDYILDEPQTQEIAWAVPVTSGQLESEISEVILSPDFIENTSPKSTSLESLTEGDALQIEDLPESTGVTDGYHLYSNTMPEKDKKDEDNRLPEWASEALQPTIRPMISREEFKSQLESLMSSPPQMPSSSKRLQTPPSPSLTPSPSSQSLESTSGGKPPSAPPPPPPPLPQQLPSSSAEEALPKPIPSAPPLPPPLPPITIMATKL